MSIQWKRHLAAFEKRLEAASTFYSILLNGRNDDQGQRFIRKVGKNLCDLCRDVIAHEYFDIDAEQIFSICQTDIPPLRDTVKKMKWA